ATGTSMISMASGPPGVRTTAARNVGVPMANSFLSVARTTMKRLLSIRKKALRSAYLTTREEGGPMPTMTAAQRRAQAKAEYDAFLAGCPSRQLLDRIADKWVALVLAALGSDGPHPRGEGRDGGPRSMRYSELSR